LGQVSGVLVLLPEALAVAAAEQEQVRAQAHA